MGTEKNYAHKKEKKSISKFQREYTYIKTEGISTEPLERRVVGSGRQEEGKYIKLFSNKCDAICSGMVSNSRAFSQM